jgi:aminopeptidase N
MRNLFIIICFFLFNLSFAQNVLVNHNLKVKISPENSSIDVTDQFYFTENGSSDLEFSLNSQLSITSHSPNVSIEVVGDKTEAADFGMDRDDAGDVKSGLILNTYRIVPLKGFSKGDVIEIKYNGKIESPIEQSEANYQRGFSESPGIIAEKGIYLAGSTYWVPYFKDKMVQFSLTTQLPEGWKTVSQGSRILENISEGNHTDQWKEDQPQEEIFLIAAKFSEYAYNAGNVKAMAFLRTPDEGLANKYLETTAQYMEMYRTLVGPFPYSKFALVENFWETGYGMPSFTLLGEKIIRFPFILHSSYPHELLHNYWGNSVYVDFETGNWCEGLTAYMADHLIKEQRSQGDAYRRTTLQKFADYVTEENDFPVNTFLSRHNASSETIGYGKVSMIFHMLRRNLGEEVFVKAIQRFNRNNAFKVASWADIQSAFEDASGSDLTAFFDQWISRKGAPELSLNNVIFEKGKLEFTIEQLQKYPAFSISVPVIIETESGKKLLNVALDQKKHTFTQSFEGENIISVQVDPMYDVFRVLHPDEVPSSLSKAYGAKKTAFVLPSGAGKEEIKMYEDFIRDWRTGNEGEFEVLSDNSLNTWPVDQTVWILGYQNKLANSFLKGLERFDLTNNENALQLGEKQISKTENSTIITSKHPQNLDEVLVFFAIDRADAISGLVRKLPHYGKYSYLAFEGEEPTNVVKGQWDVLDSPLVRKNNTLGKDIKMSNTTPDAAVNDFYTRNALAKLKPVFSSDRIMKDVEYLASEELKGRGLGTPELDKAAEYIATEFEKAGLLPGEIANYKLSYFQTWTTDIAGKGNVKLMNVVGAIEGDEKYANEPVVISAHYDHLGTGWPDAHRGDAGKIHYGADDNASGVAIMLELARHLKKNVFPLRPIIFVAFTGEEAGLLGSKHFVDLLIRRGITPFANINFDTNGRLFDKPLLILNGNTAREWKFIFMGTEYVTGVKTELVQQQIDASDQVSFNAKGIPAVQFFSGANHDYHRPSDVIEKLDPNGMVKIAMVAKEVIQYLGERTDPMPYTGENIKANETKKGTAPKKERKASTGSMPDVGYSGEGVRIAAVSEGSPGAKAGLIEGDIILSFDGQAVKNLREYSDELKKRQPGDKVILEVLRGDKKIKKEIILGER